MANCCYFSLRANGFSSKADKEAVLEVFNNTSSATKNGCDTTRPYMALYDSEVVEDEEKAFELTGDCKWSCHTSLLKNGYFTRDKDTSSNYTCLEELSKKYKCNFEVYSEETGCCFQEHIIVKNGELVLNDSVDYERVELCDSWEEFLENSNEEERKILNISTKKEWNKAIKSCSFVDLGGYGYWDWTI